MFVTPVKTQILGPEGLAETRVEAQERLAVSPPALLQTRLELAAAGVVGTPV